MHLNVHAYVIFIILQHSTCDYMCLCNYNVEQPVYKNADSSEIPVGALYEYDCNTLISDSYQLWSTIAYHHKVAFVEKNPQTRIQMCHGEIPEMDKLLMPTTTEMPTIQNKATKATTLAITPNPTTTMSTTTTQGTKLTTNPSTTAFMSTTTTQATTLTTNPSPKAFMSTTTSQATTRSTTTIPTTTMPSTITLTTLPTTNTPTTTTDSTSAILTNPSPKIIMSTTTTQATTRSTTAIPITTRQTNITSTLPITKTPTTTTISTSAISIAASTSIDGNLDLCNAYIKYDADKINGFLGQHGEYCYELVDSPTEWGTAETHCKLFLNGSLVHILSQNEQDYIVKFLSSHTYIKSVWIGLTDSNIPSIAVFNSTEGNWKWSSGASYTYNNFGSEFTSHTDHEHNRNDCVVMHQGGEWSDLPCGINFGIFGIGESHPYICQYNITSSVVSVVSIINEVNELVG